jgi:hypothetical protein
LLDGSLNTIAAARNADGKLEIFGTDFANRVFSRTQTTAGTDNRDGWASLDGWLSRVSAETNGNGQVELFGVNPNGDHFFRYQTSAGSASWSDWSQ